MNEVLSGYNVNEPTWFYLSLLLILAVFFKFSRPFSLRNLDLLLLLLVAPGLLLVRGAPSGSVLGYVWLITISALLLVRCLLDVVLTRRPRLEQNLNPAGMAFLCVAALGFQVTNVITRDPVAATVDTVRRADDLLKRQDATAESERQDVTHEAGPASTLLMSPVMPLVGGVEIAAARTTAILAHLSVVLGLICVGRWHFADTKLGLAMATLYLLLPVTAYDVGRVNHLLPAALIVWAIAAYRSPIAAGILLGLASGGMFFAAFLLPIWTAFYWGRGAVKFTLALGVVAVVLLVSLMLTSADSHSLTRQIIGSIDWSLLKFESGEGVGFWSLYDQAFRIPVFATFLVLLVALTIWPLGKSVEHLISHSCAIVIATQFWYPHQGGIYVLWYLPILLMVTFRPRLAHLPTASTVEAWAKPLVGKQADRTLGPRAVARTQALR